MLSHFFRTALPDYSTGPQRKSTLRANTDESSPDQLRHTSWSFSTAQNSARSSRQNFQRGGMLEQLLLFSRSSLKPCVAWEINKHQDLSVSSRTTLRASAELAYWISFLQDLVIKDFSRVKDLIVKDFSSPRMESLEVFAINLGKEFPWVLMINPFWVMLLTALKESWENPRFIAFFQHNSTSERGAPDKRCLLKTCFAWLYHKASLTILLLGFWVVSLRD